MGTPVGFGFTYSPDRQAAPPSALRDGHRVTAPHRCGGRIISPRHRISGMCRSRAGLWKTAAGFCMGRSMTRGQWFMPAKLPTGRGIRRGGGKIERRRAAGMKRTGRGHAKPAKADACRGKKTSVAGRANLSCSALPGFANCSPSASGPRARRDIWRCVFAPLFFARMRAKKESRNSTST